MTLFKRFEEWRKLRRDDNACEFFADWFGGLCREHAANPWGSGAPSPAAIEKFWQWSIEETRKKFNAPKWTPRIWGAGNDSTEK